MIPNIHNLFICMYFSIRKITNNKLIEHTILYIKSISQRQYEFFNFFREDYKEWIS